MEGLTRTLGVTGFTIELQDVDFIIYSPLLFTASPSRRGVGNSGGATKASGF